jgi:hypothetical protein
LNSSIFPGKDGFSGVAPENIRYLGIGLMDFEPMT